MTVLYAGAYAPAYRDGHLHRVTYTTCASGWLFTKIIKPESNEIRGKINYSCLKCS